MPPAPLDSFKDGDGPVARLYNWNLLGPVLKPFGIVLDDNAKSLLVAGGAQTREQKNAIPIRLRRLSRPPPPPDADDRSLLSIHRLGQVRVAPRAVLRARRRDSPAVDPRGGVPEPTRRRASRVQLELEKLQRRDGQRDGVLEREIPGTVQRPHGPPHE
eukprot:30854-Pelagococcus_subviridis.AAC.4